MNKIMAINDIPPLPETTCEDVTFVAPTDASTRYPRDSRVKNCTFRNCEFETYSMGRLNLEVVNCVFENCTFGFKAVCASLIHCTFRNCTFSDGFKSAFGLWTTFFECDYDDSFLESLSKEMVCPLSGEFVGWKKGYLCKRSNDSLAIKMYPVIVKLLIPSESRRSSALSNKCRCEKAMVLEVQTFEGTKIDIPEDCFVASMFEFDNARERMENQFAMSRYITTKEKQPVMMKFLKTKYVPGEMVYPDSFNTDPLIACTGGIHFFMIRVEACAYAIY